MADTANGSLIKHASIAISIIDTCAVLLRLLARWRSKAVFAADDYLITISLLPLYAMITLGFFGMDMLPPRIVPMIC